MENIKNPSLREKIDDIRDGHQEQFDIAVNAAFQRGFGRWFDDTWTSARAAGAKPNPFISSMFVFLTTILMKKFVAGLPAELLLPEKEQAISEAVVLLKGYIDQIEAAGIKELYAPPPTLPVTPKGNEKPQQTIIQPKKRILRAKRYN